MKRIARAAAALIVATACQRATPSKPPAPSAHTTAAPAPTNLLTMTRGAAVVSRSAEALLSTSALRAIDGDPSSSWLSPPHSPRQTIVFSLPALTRITSVGFAAGADANRSTHHLTVEFSKDGSNFVQGGSFSLKKESSTQRFNVPPFEGHLIRVNTIDAYGSFASLGQVEVNGTELEPPASPSLSGCWSINDDPASFQQSGAHVSGRVAGRIRTLLDGGTDGRMFRFAWIRGAEYGLGAMTVTFDGSALDAMIWHEQALSLPQFTSPDWLGNKAAGACDAPPDGDEVFRTYLRRFGYFPLFGLHFDGEGHLDDSASAATLARVTALLVANRGMNVRLIAHELRQRTSRQNLAITSAETESLRKALSKLGAPLDHVTFVPAGDQHPRRDADREITRAMYSAVEIEVAH